MKNRHFFTFFLGFLLTSTLSCQHQAQDLKDFSSRVIGIKDGDTIEVLYEKKPLKIRLADVDCPENGQPYARNAKQFTSDACFGKTVRVESNGKKDRYGRLIATIYLPDGLVLNEELLKAGMAWHYKKYSKKDHYADLEEAAYQDSVGLWADDEPIAPWEWRK